MKDFFKSVRFKIIAGLLAVLLGIMVYSAVSGGSDSLISSAVGAVLSPVQKLSQIIYVKVTETMDMLANASDYYKENQKLKREVSELENRMADYLNTVEENERLREMLELKEKNKDISLSEPCSVIGRTANDITGSFFIDKGSADGISVDDPVITPSGLIGFVFETQLTYSKVRTVLSPKISLGVFCAETGDTGILEGNYSLASDELFTMKFINSESQIKPGNLIITSGYSGIVPKGLLAGTVEGGYPDESGLSLTAVVRPVVPPSSLTSVFVITDFTGKGEKLEN